MEEMATVTGMDTAEIEEFGSETDMTAAEGVGAARVGAGNAAVDAQAGAADSPADGAGAEAAAQAFPGGAGASVQDPAELARQRQALIDGQLREIAALDPEVRSLSDLTRSESYDALYALVKRGATLSEAYRLANFERLMRRAEQAAVQRYRNGLAGTRHLAATVNRASGGVPVPADVAAQYRALNPGISDGEIARHYNRYHVI